ncbi:Uncharacterised protein [uncultured Clostridium sp.]|uniref:amidase domain-containing protein n=1 Tax=uncultured Clostridium sp. TaxID=59620 RepID=UPI000823018F|nr:amidase domain-containing protein [uncultured Clostridium sp.]SCJ03124.1 Uncharacterised protein [uncultured Clostridium sp.]
MKYFKNDRYFSNNLKNFLYFVAYSVFIITIFFLFALNISKTSNLTSNNYSLEDDSFDVGSFNKNTISLELKATEFINNLFSDRNDAFLTGYIKDLSKFYNLTHTNSTYSFNNELKRIAYLRDWAIERGVIFTSITSNVTIKNLKDNGDTITFKADENCEFNYVYYDDNTENTFNVNLIHILSLNKLDNSFEIEKDYYLDFLNNTSNNYAYNLNGGNLEFSKSFNKNFTLVNEFNIGDILSYKKFNFVDHKGVVCGYDSKNYPLINSTTINSNNIPFDLGWKEKNIYKE